MRKHLIRRLSSLAVLSVFLSFQMISTAYAGLTWAAYGSDISLPANTAYLISDYVFDNAGDLHIAAIEFDTSSAFDSTKILYGTTPDNGSTYNWTTIETIAGDFEANSPMRIKLDDNGDPGILYYLDDEATGGGANTPEEYLSIRFAHSNNWNTVHTIAEIDTGVGQLDTPSADFDFLSSGNPEVYLCYDTDGNDPDIYRHAWTGGSFPTGSFPAVNGGDLVYDVSSGGDSCQGTKIEIDGSDARHVVFATGTTNKDGGVKYTTSTDGTTWGTPSTVFSSDANRINGADIVLDSSDYPVVMSVLNTSGVQGSPTNTIQISKFNGASWTTPSAVISAIDAGYEIPDDVMNKLLSISGGYQYVGWTQSVGNDHQVVVANNESGSWITDVVHTITEPTLFSHVGGYLGYETPLNKVTVSNLLMGATELDAQFYQATAGDDVATGGGGAVPEFQDYMLVLTVLLAVGMMTRQKNLLGKLSA